MEIMKEKIPAITNGVVEFGDKVVEIEKTINQDDPLRDVHAKIAIAYAILDLAKSVRELNETINIRMR